MTITFVYHTNIQTYTTILLRLVEFTMYIYIYILYVV